MVASSVVMVRPHGAAFNPETALDNSFQSPGEPQEVRAEFEGAVAALRGAGVEVLIVEGEPDLPDAHFPNNWFSTHPDGRLMVYEMAHPSRRAETRLLSCVLEALDSYKVEVDHMPEGWALEGTGSLVFDHTSKTAFAAISPRTHPDAVAIACARLGYAPVTFETCGDIYHTNVCLAIGPNWAILCPSALKEPNPVLSQLRETGKQVQEISLDQMNQFGANVLALKQGVAMSASADRALGGLDIGPRIVAEIPTIERLGGGSMRCMIAENFLPKRS